MISTTFNPHNSINGTYTPIPDEDTPLTSSKLRNYSAIESLREPQPCCLGGFCKPRFRRHCDIWILLTVIAFFSAVLSFTMELATDELLKAKLALASDNYLKWIIISVFSVWFTAWCAKMVAPESVGSGIPEMKAIIKGVEINNFLEFPVLLVKYVGLILVISLGGLPLGKEAPLIHMAAILAICVSGIGRKHGFETDMQRTDILISACATGLSTALMSPIGSFLLTIEINSTYFSLRHYWHGFYGAVCATILVTLLYAPFQRVPNTVPFYGTGIKFFIDDGRELILYAILGIICGFFGVLYVRLYRFCLEAFNSFQKHKLQYAVVITFIISSITYPGWRQMMGVQLSNHQQIEELFSNFSWTKTQMNVREGNIVSHWVTDDENVLLNLLGYSLYVFFFSILSSTMAIPWGLLNPILRVGAGMGRIFGEIVRQLGFKASPGAFAIAGAAAFTGSVTHALSIAIIAFEVTGEMTDITPIMVCIIISNSIAFFFSPSLHDTGMLLKGLPYIPNLINCGSIVSRFYVDEFMLKDVPYIWDGMTYTELNEVITNSPSEIDQFPVVDNQWNRFLIGSIQRDELDELLENQLGRTARLNEMAPEFRMSDSCLAMPLLRLDHPAVKPRRWSHILDESTPVDGSSFERKWLDVVDFGQVTIDPAPFQVVQSASLLMVHSLFMMVGVHLAYVTNMGLLVGVVGLEELRHAIEGGMKVQLGGWRCWKKNQNEE